MVPPVFKTGERCAVALAGSIPVRLRHLRIRRDIGSRDGAGGLLRAARKRARENNRGTSAYDPAPSTSFAIELLTPDRDPAEMVAEVRNSLGIGVPRVRYGDGQRWWKIWGWIDQMARYVATKAVLIAFSSYAMPGRQRKIGDVVELSAAEVTAIGLATSGQ